MLTSVLIEATLEQPACQCVDQSDVRMAAYVPAGGESMNNANVCSCRWTASGVLVRDYLIWFWNSPFSCLLVGDRY